MSNSTEKVENGIRKIIEDIVKKEYAKRGHRNVIPQVTVKFQERISVFINTEDPFLGENFWKLLSEVGKKMDNAVKVFGYVYKGTKYLSDFCVIQYEFKTE